MNKKSGNKVRCNDYLVLKKIITNYAISSIESKNKTVKFKYTPIFARFSSLKTISSYIYHFKLKLIIQDWDTKL